MHVLGDERQRVRVRSRGGRAVAGAIDERVMQRAIEGTLVNMSVVWRQFLRAIFVRGEVVLRDVLESGTLRRFVVLGSAKLCGFGSSPDSRLLAKPFTAKEWGSRLLER